MRIIAGIHRSRTLLGPKGTQTTRPITDRVKTALFDRLASWGLLDQGFAVDVFAGTGSLGLEALSRGIEHCTFIERDRTSHALLKQNIAALKLEGQSSVMQVDALGTAWLSLLTHQPVSLMFVDPPYRMLGDAKDRERLTRMLEHAAGVLKPHGMVTLRGDQHAKPLEPAGYLPPDSYAYGSMVLHLYERKPQDVASESK